MEVLDDREDADSGSEEVSGFGEEDTARDFGCDCDCDCDCGCDCGCDCDWVSDFGKEVGEELTKFIGAGLGGKEPGE